MESMRVSIDAIWIIWKPFVYVFPLCAFYLILEVFQQYFYILLRDFFFDLIFFFLFIFYTPIIVVVVIIIKREIKVCNCVKSVIEKERKIVKYCESLYKPFL